MKEKKFLLALNDIDEKYIDEASGRVPDQNKRTKKIILIAAIAAVFAMLAVVLFIPYNDTPKKMLEYSDSEYYDLIERLNEYYYIPRKNKNLYQTIVDKFSKYEKSGPDIYDDDLYYDNPSISIEGSANYVEVTDVQVVGVGEADLLKRTDKHLFYLYGCDYIQVYSIEGKASKIINGYQIPWSERVWWSEYEMFLSSDCKTLTVLGYSEKEKFEDGVRKTGVSVCSLDVTDPMNIKLINQINIYGKYIDVRMIDGDLYLISGFSAVQCENYDNKENYVPYTVANGEIDYISRSSIYTPDEIKSTEYTVLTKLDAKTLEKKSELALFSFAGSVLYATDKSIYIASKYDEDIENETNQKREMSEIYKIDYSGDEFENVGSVVVDGAVNDQYSMDEYDGMLRVFTSTNVFGVTSRGSRTGWSKKNASLYIVDAETLKIINSVENFAPKGEEVKSARFDKTAAYVCTSKEFEPMVYIDPVYFYDLSDVNNITCKDTGTIDGFSRSLVDFGDGYLLGLGLVTEIDENGRPVEYGKIEVYKEEGDKVVSVSSMVLSGLLPEDYKSYYIDRERGYIGFYLGYNESEDSEYGYYILKFENDVLSVAYCLSGDEMSICILEEYIRNVYIDGYFYVLTGTLYAIAEGELNISWSGAEDKYGVMWREYIAFAGNNVLLQSNKYFTMAKNYDAIVNNHFTRPIFRLDTYKEYEEFNDKYVLVGKLNEGVKRNYPSFEEVTAHCDEEFFENNSLIVVFVEKGDAGIKGYKFGKDYLLVKMGKRKGSEEGIFCVVSVPDTDIELFTEFKTKNGY